MTQISTLDPALCNRDFLTTRDHGISWDAAMADSLVGRSLRQGTKSGPSTVGECNQQSANRRAQRITSLPQCFLLNLGVLIQRTQGPYPIDLAAVRAERKLDEHLPEVVSATRIDFPGDPARLVSETPTAESPGQVFDPQPFQHGLGALEPGAALLVLHLAG